MEPTTSVEFDVIGSSLVDIRVAIFDQMERFLADSGQTVDWNRLRFDIDGDMLDVSAPGGYRSMPGKYVAHCVYSIDLAR